jgi:hypothetical protein
MSKKIPLIFLSVIPLLLPAQEIFRNEGITINNTITDAWMGINIPRNVRTTVYFLNNSVTSVNLSGYMLQAGDENPGSTNNNLDGEIISGNKFVWNGVRGSSDPITHGIFTGYNVNALIKYNYLLNVPMGVIRKSDGMTNTSGGVAYNIIKNPVATAVVVKGMNNVNIYNNTFYSNQVKYGGAGTGTWRGLIEIYGNDGLNPMKLSTNTKIKNNIFYTVYQISNITLGDSKADLGCEAGFESDYNIFYCESGTPVFTYMGESKTFAQWQALGYDIHSVVINPGFINTTGFVPGKRLDYGTNLGTEWQTGLSTSAAWNAGSSPATTNQNGKWQAGAVIYPEAATTPPVTSPPVVVNTPPVVVVSYSPDNLSGFVGELDATGSYDSNNDKLSYTWAVPVNIPVSSTSTAKVKFLSPVVSSPQTIEFTLKISDGKTTQSKTIPVKILPYKPELEFAEILNIEASSYQSPYYPYNILDGNIGTMWSANGNDQWLIMELKDLFNIQHVKIAFQPGQKKTSYFDIFGSQDRETWEPILIKSASCGFSGDLHVFDFPESKSSMEFRYIKLIGHSNSADTWNYISEFKIFGYKFRNPGSYEKQAVKLYPNPADVLVNVRIDDSTLKPDFIRIVNLTGKVVYEDKIDPEIRDFQVPVDFKQGIYIVQLGSGELTFFAQKLVVNI